MKALRKRSGVDHADDWLMTYADVITLLLCFFALFLSISLAKVHQKEEALAQQHALLAQTIESPIMESEASEIEQDFTHVPAVDLSPLPVSSGSRLSVLHEDEIESSPLAALPQEDNKVYAVLPLSSISEVIAQLKKNIEARMEDKEEEGERISTIEMNSSTFFPVGSAILSADGEKILSEVVKKITGTTYQDYQVTVEGHTDDTPIHTVLFPSNWELSTARAAAVVRYFIDQGVPSERLRASGYADAKPKVPNRDVSGTSLPNNQALNRRVVIKLEKREGPSLAVPLPSNKTGA